MLVRPSDWLANMAANQGRKVQNRMGLHAIHSRTIVMRSSFIPRSCSGSSFGHVHLTSINSTTSCHSHDYVSCSYPHHCNIALYCAPQIRVVPERRDSRVSQSIRAGPSKKSGTFQALLLHGHLLHFAATSSPWLSIGVCVAKERSS